MSVASAKALYIIFPKEPFSASLPDTAPVKPVLRVCRISCISWSLYHGIDSVWNNMHGIEHEVYSVHGMMPLHISFMHGAGRAAVLRIVVRLQRQSP